LSKYYTITAAHNIFYNTLCAIHLMLQTLRSIWLINQRMLQNVCIS